MTPAAAEIRIEGLSWRPEGRPVLDEFSVGFAHGRLTAIVGPSGCGKSSLLRLIAGLRPADGGRVLGRMGPQAFVFQDPALLPWLTLRENVLLPNTLSGDAPDPAAAQSTLVELGLADHAEHLPAALSGGQRMRASLARALLARPSLVLLDEPFAALDRLTRRALQALVLERSQGEGWTTLLVTHDLGDAARLAQRVLVVDGPPLRVVADIPCPQPRPRDPEAVGEVVRAIEAAS
jgi:ABC-type nitrate/sulfonate/bicarbonate transport system ATPase subunit